MKLDLLLFDFYQLDDPVVAVNLVLSICLQFIVHPDYLAKGMTCNPGVWVGLKWSEAHPGPLRLATQWT